MDVPSFVIPAKAGIQYVLDEKTAKSLDSGLHPVMSGLRNAYIEMKNLEVA
jgi:hypothetical protein